ncbi:Alcohol dehydrogenase GroES-like domain-containing protein [Cladophialophora immunda]|nr:Alcohol dehydrogenase GroES-like domain-containing protein [Cladophialophora immunda]
MVAEPPKTRAIVARAPIDGKRQWKLEEVDVPPLRENEVLVEIVASGVCHTDLICGSGPENAGGFPLPPYPRILGHEGAGYVRAVGSGVKKVAPGDSVLLSFAYCTKCHNCKFGAPGYCANFTPLNFAGDQKAFTEAGKADTAIGGSFFGQSSFSRLLKAQETSVINVSGLVKNESDLKLFAPLGCGIQTGAGTITELGAASQSDKVAVIGLGGVGLAAVMAAKMRNCQVIIGIDRLESRLEMAKTLGATHVINTAGLNKPLADVVHGITSGSGTTITVDATGVVALIQQGIELTANQGKMILLGVAPMDAGLEIAIVPYMVTGKQLLGSMEGGVRPIDYVPRMIQWYRSGRFPIDKLVKYFPVENFQEALHEMEAGTAIKPILIW